MPTITKQLLYWAPRLLGIVFILLVSTFALDVFSENGAELVLTGTVTAVGTWDIEAHELAVGDRVIVRGDLHYFRAKGKALNAAT